MIRLFLILISFSLIFPSFGSIKSNFIITNRTGKVLYVYDYTYGSSVHQKPILVIESKKSRVYTLKQGNMRRLTFSNQKFTKTLEVDIMPDPLNPGADGNIPWTDIEYTLNGKNINCIDISYIDAFSYPITINIKGYKKTWGINNINTAARELEKQGNPWKNLVVKDNKGKVFKIVGPNKAMYSVSLAPSCIKVFNKEFPSTGKKLSPTNGAAWQSSATQPATTGYVKGLHNAASGAYKFDNIKMYGFFLYPLDNDNGQFNNLSINKKITLTVYQAGNGGEKYKWASESLGRDESIDPRDGDIELKL